MKHIISAVIYGPLKILFLLKEIAIEWHIRIKINLPALNSLHIIKSIKWFKFHKKNINNVIPNMLHGNVVCTRKRRYAM